MKHYKQFKITAEPFIPDIITGELWELKISGINEGEYELTVYCDETAEINKSDIEKILSALTKENLLKSFEITEELIEDKNWNEEWEKKVRVIEVTDKIVIKPSFKEYNKKENQIVITIDPKMSFGTGEHQTTQLMLELIEKYVEPGDKVLDIGSGTGVLAISAVKLGASYALGIDNDEWCLNNGIENVKSNMLEEKVEIRLAEMGQIEENDFNLIVANINKNILLEIADQIGTKIKKAGRLIISGLLLTDETQILNKYTSFGFQFVEKLTKDEWIALVFTFGGS